MLKGMNLNWIAEFGAAVEEAEREERKEREERERNDRERNEIERNERERLKRERLEMNIRELFVHGLLDHGHLQGERLFDVLHEFRLLINRNTTYDLQDFRQFAQPLNFVRRLDEQIPNEFDVQILLSENGNHFCTAYYPKRGDSRKFFAYKPVQSDPNENQKTIARRMYGEDIMKEWRFVRTFDWPDDGNHCDCAAIFALAYAILLVQQRDPARFEFKMSNDTNLSTFYIRKKLIDMFSEQRLMMFDEEI